MQELIKIKKENGIDFVGSLRTLYENVGMDLSNWSRWLKKNVEENLFFIESLDYQLFVIKTNGRNLTDCCCSLDMAKHLIVQMPTEKAHEYRQYLIDYEKKDKIKVPTTLKEALLLAIEQQEKIEQQQKTIEYKEDVIIGLVEDIDLSTKRQRITQIVRYNSKNFQDRYRLLYTEFEKKYHCDLERRLSTYNSKNKPKLNKMAYIDQVMNKIPQLYELTCKIFENDVNKLKKEWFDIIKDKEVI